DRAGPGSACRLDGRCGCFDDLDCGEAQSGRVCSGATQTCVSGCRTAGGNSCPAGFRCENTPRGTGACVATGTVVDAGPSNDFGGAGGCSAGHARGAMASVLALALAALVRRRRQG
ncbi:MAG: hypothetical protein HY905_16745, partial [Deltaproteobacteria bacterium]|nr:hypothetical protein [Deltaproteobacteria bacterium]